MSATVAVPAIVPPEVQSLGAPDCGPKTLKVIVPVAPLVPPNKPELIDPVEIAVPDVSVAGAVAVTAVEFLTTVDVMPDPHVLAEEALLESPG